MVKSISGFVIHVSELSEFSCIYEAILSRARRYKIVLIGRRYKMEHYNAFDEDIRMD
tara:strand:+ start:1107 stop:1277 length:171 start_codon:yes stop_codon:yes gene_type:complete